MLLHLFFSIPVAPLSCPLFLCPSPAANLVESRAGEKLVVVRTEQQEQEGRSGVAAARVFPRSLLPPGLTPAAPQPVDLGTDPRQQLFQMPG